MINIVIVCQELLHSIKRKQDRRGAMVLKLDLAKAYDQLELPFIHEIQLDADLPTSHAAIIMKCITGGCCRLLWNGKATDPIQPSHGLRQGDPLSTYLFVLFMERFAQWIELKKTSKEWRSIRASRWRPSFSHLFFADDVVLFVEATKDQADLIKQGLEEFCFASGQ